MGFETPPPRMLAIDFETYLIAPGMLCPKPVCMSYSNGPYSNVRLAKDVIPEPGPIVGCNIAFDMAVAWQHLDWDVWELYENKRVTDVAVREQLIDIRKGLGTKRSYSLQSLAKRRLKLELDKEGSPRLAYHTVAGTPISSWPNAYVDYALKDAEITYKIWEDQEKENCPNVKRWEHYETYAAFCLYLMSAWGIRADTTRWAQLKKDVDVKYQKLLKQYRDIGVLREDGTKDKGKLQELVNTAYNGNPPRTDKGGIKTDRLTLDESGDEVLESLTGDGPIEKIVTTYGKVIEEACERPYNSRYQILKNTGRTSGNFQQWPRGGPNSPDEVNRLRACFQARPGYLFCSVDFTGAELVSFAQVAYRVLGWSNMRDALNAGLNLHTKLAARFIGCSYEDAAKRVKAKDPIAVAARQGAKPTNFGRLGMMGPDKLVLTAHKDFVFFCELEGVNKECSGSRCKACLKIATTNIRLFDEEWTEVPHYFKWIFNNASDPFSSPLTGFQRGGMFASDASNHPFQHLTSRMAKSALVALAKECYSSDGGKFPVLRGSRPIVFAHDEIIAEIPSHHASSGGDAMCAVMVSAAQRWCPDVKLTAEPALMRNWWKGAECVRDANGVLQVWEPK